jgi:hypothetical protein
LEQGGFEGSVDAFLSEWCGGSLPYGAWTDHDDDDTDDDDHHHPHHFVALGVQSLEQGDFEGSVDAFLGEWCGGSLPYGAWADHDVDHNDDDDHHHPHHFVALGWQSVEQGGFEGSVDAFLSEWCGGSLPYGAWADHLLSWRGGAAGDTRVLVLEYEDLKRDLRG